MENAFVVMVSYPMNLWRTSDSATGEVSAISTNGVEVAVGVSVSTNGVEVAVGVSVLTNGVEIIVGVVTDAGEKSPVSTFPQAASTSTNSTGSRNDCMYFRFISTVPQLYPIPHGVIGSLGSSLCRYYIRQITDE